MEHSPDVKVYCAKEYLNYIRSLERRIRLLDEEIVHQRALLELSGVDYSEGVSGSPSKSQLEAGVIKLQGMISEYCNELSEYVEQQKIAHSVLNQLTPKYRDVLKSYYVIGKTWEQICVDMSYSWQGMMSLRRRALQEVYDYMPEEWRRYSIPNAK